MRRRYRYIIANYNPSDPIWKYYLFSNMHIGSLCREPGRVYIRVWIPDDMKLNKGDFNDYSTTDDDRTIADLGYDVIMTQWNGKRKVISSNFSLKIEEMKIMSDEQLKKWSKSLFSDYKTAYRLRETK